MVNLVGIAETTHTRHDTEDVVVHSVNSDLGTLGGLVGQLELEHSRVDA